MTLRKKKLPQILFTFQEKPVEKFRNSKIQRIVKEEIKYFVEFVPFVKKYC